MRYSCLPLCPLLMAGVTVDAFSSPAPARVVYEVLRELAEAGPSDALAASDVEGVWQLVFSSLLPSGYTPVRELIGFYPSRAEAFTDSALGPLPIGGSRGHCLWNGGVENEIAFTTDTVVVGSWIVAHHQLEVKTYRFFFHDDGKKVLAARRSGGGFVLLSRA